MLASDVSLDLMEFVEKNILPRYSKFDKAHGIKHAIRVIENSLELAKTCGADANMAYTIAAYHDLGLEGPRAVHHLHSGKIIMADQRLCKWFSNEQIKIMKEAVEDHRASSSHAPRNLYGKIVAEADRDLEPREVFRRSIEYGIYHYPGNSKEEHWHRFNSHMQNKYSSHGYIRLWLPHSPNEMKLQQIRHIIACPQLLRKIFDELYKKESLLQDGQTKNE